MREEIIKDIQLALELHQGFFHNEKEIQIYLSNYLINSKKFDNVFYEYYVNINLIPNYIWNNNNKLSIDIVLLKENIYYPIEIKYKTRSQILPHFVFGTLTNVALENHAAQTLGRYSYWKDIKRMELLEENFQNVSQGIVLFVTNDSSYIQAPLNQQNGGAPFSIHQGKEVNQNEFLNWNAELAVAANNPGFQLNRNYSINWNAMNIENHQYII